MSPRVADKTLHSVYLNLKMDIPLNLALLLYTGAYLFLVVKPLDSQKCLVYKHVNPLDGANSCDSCCAAYGRNVWSGKMVVSILLFVIQVIRFLLCIFYMSVNSDRFGDRSLMHIFLLQIKHIPTKVSRQICYAVYLPMYIMLTTCASDVKIEWSNVDYAFLGLNLLVTGYLSSLLMDYHTLAVYKAFITWECLGTFLPLVYFLFGPHPTEWTNNTPPLRSISTQISFYASVVCIPLFVGSIHCLADKEANNAGYRKDR